MMYRGTPPIFDTPEFPTLRRIKPIPKRRRTTGPGHEALAETPTFLASQENDAIASHSQQRSVPPSVDSYIPSGAAEELLSRVGNHSTRMALQNYYLPILGNVQNFLANHGATAASGDGGSSATAAASAAAAALVAIAGAGRNGSLPIPPLADLDSIEFGVHFAAAAAAAAAGLPMGGLSSLVMGSAGGTTGGDGKADTTCISAMSPSVLHDGAGLDSTGEYESSVEGREEESSREDDYACHVFQPGNTKKRKVPANLSGSPRGIDNAGKGGSPYSDSVPGVDGVFHSKEVNLTKEQDGDDNDSTPSPPFPGQLSQLIQKKGKLTAATLAGLQHKEQLKSRKTQLTTVMGAVSQGDSLALDQALSLNYPFVRHSGERLKMRKSKRKSVRLARAMNILMERPERKNRHPDAVRFPQSDFGFKCASLTADRLVTTKEEIARLRKRFEAELEEHEGVKVGTASEGGKGLGKSGRAKRERQERERERVARAARQKKSKSEGEEDSEKVEAKSKTGKKKKRSALANASNVRNYVPSGDELSGTNILPHAVRFLSAEIPSKGNRRVVGNNTQAGEEWICAFCEYELFYGDERAYRKGVGKRKKVLRRRRRAAEKAAAAASGGGGINEEGK